MAKDAVVPAVEALVSQGVDDVEKLALTGIASKSDGTIVAGASDHASHIADAFASEVKTAADAEVETVAAQVVVPAGNGRNTFTVPETPASARTDEAAVTPVMATPVVGIVPGAEVDTAPVASATVSPATPGIVVTVGGQTGTSV